jgi:hypothetical protein
MLSKSSTPLPHSLAQRENIRVVCRVRPLNKKEQKERDSCCLNHSTQSIEIFNSVGQYPFEFDQIFGENTSQSDVFQCCAVPLIEDVLNGFNATICAYGQTGSGMFSHLSFYHSFTSTDLLSNAPFFSTHSLIQARRTPLKAVSPTPLGVASCPDLSVR